MPRNLKAEVSGKAVLRQLSAQLLEELIPSPVTKEQFEDTRDILGIWIENTEGSVLDEGLQCLEDPGLQRYPDCRHGWHEGHQQRTQRAIHRAGRGHVGANGVCHQDALAH